VHDASGLDERGSPLQDRGSPITKVATETQHSKCTKQAPK